MLHVVPHSHKHENLNKVMIVKEHLLPCKKWDMTKMASMNGYLLGWPQWYLEYSN